MWEEKYFNETGPMGYESIMLPLQHFYIYNRTQDWVISVVNQR